jgi:hypothetical protein
MSTVKRIEFGNYTLKCGEYKVLLDMFDDLVMPSFHEMRYIRKLKDKGEYFFLDTKIIVLKDDKTNPELGITGRIVKNTKLKREQIFSKEGGLVEKAGELETAPSSTFLLVLSNHRLILCQETTGAPNIQNFQSTSQYCLSARYKEFIQEEYDKDKGEKEKNDKFSARTKKALTEQTPRPFLRITPLPDKQDLNSFVGRFKHIDELTIKLLPTNNEDIDNDDFWASLDTVGNEMNSKRTALKFSNTKEGLNPVQALKQTSSATSLGNSEVKFKGYDEQGDTIKGSNDDFSLTIELEDIPKDIERAAQVKYGQFMHLVQSQVIKLPHLVDHAAEKVKSIFERL